MANLLLRTIVVVLLLTCVIAAWIVSGDTFCGVITAERPWAREMQAAFIVLTVALGVLLMIVFTRLLLAPGRLTKSRPAPCLTSPLHHPDYEPLKTSPHLKPDMEQLRRLDEHIKIEYEWTAQRVTYLAISESFLFGAYAAAHGSLKAGPAHEHAMQHGETLIRIVYTVPIIGLLMAAAVFAAVVCAISMTFKLKCAREKMEGEYFAVHRDAGWQSVEHFVGLLPPVVISASFFIAWICMWPQ